MFVTETISVDVNLGDPVHLVIEYSKGSSLIHDASKPAIFCIHGLASNRTVWRESAALLAERGYAMAYVDLLGHGDSEPTILRMRSGLVSKFGILKHCECLEQVLNKLRQSAAVESVEGTRSIAESDAISSHQLLPDVPIAWTRPCLLVGHSYGATIAIEFSIRHPSLIQSLVCVDGGFINLQRLYPDFASCIMKLCPPPFPPLRFEALDGIIRTEWCRGWSELGIQYMINNFRVLTNNTVEPKLLPAMHVQLLQNLWLYDPTMRATQLKHQILLILSPENITPFTADKATDVRALVTNIPVRPEQEPNHKVVWLEAGVSHDIPAQAPVALANAIVSDIEDGFLLLIIN